MFGERTEGTVTVSTWASRVSVDTRKRITPLDGGVAVPMRELTITHPERGLIWTIHPGDTSYSEVTLQEARQLAALVPRPTKVAEKDLGPGDRVAGYATRRFRIRFRNPRLSQTPSPIDSAEFVQELWIARGVPGLDRLLAAAGSRFTDFSAFDAVAAEISRRERGAVVRSVTKLRFPQSMVAGLFKGAEADSQARAMGIDPKEGSMVVSRSETISVRLVPVRRERFDLPRGLRKRPAQQQELLETLKKSQGTPPGR
jgi:hypothetical protein